ncbi:MAG: family acetyltransferase [Ferruginibacter sp.]|nr:family acetyltransferase [Ferruginibacter sp.]
MIIREAIVEDISRMQQIRNAVKENMLPDPGLVRDEDYDLFMNEKGNGWVCAIDEKVVGFAIVDLQDHNVWALFILPEFEGRGIGKALHEQLLNWYFNQTKTTLWLGTAYNTRAEKFYRAAGWKEAGTNGPKEIRFEMTDARWKALRAH